MLWSGSPRNLNIPVSTDFPRKKNMKKEKKNQINNDLNDSSVLLLTFFFYISIHKTTFKHPVKIVKWMINNGPRLGYRPKTKAELLIQIIFVHFWWSTFESISLCSRVFRLFHYIITVGLSAFIIRDVHWAILLHYIL